RFLFKIRAPRRASTLSLHDALPISRDALVERIAGLEKVRAVVEAGDELEPLRRGRPAVPLARRGRAAVNVVAGGQEELVSADARSEEHTSELQSLRHLVCRLLLEKK